MIFRKIKDDIYAVGVNHWDRTLFDELIPLPDGTTYNSYLIRGSEKTVLIDTVDPEKKDILISNLKKLDVKKLDYIVANHAEQDHSGAIPYLLDIYPEAKVVTNEKCKAFLQKLLLIDDNKFIVIKDREILNIGNKNLEFILTPWVHWPETMVTYLKEDKILFTCDFFGSHYASSELFVTDECEVLETAKRYYAEIMMPFRNNIINHIKKLEEYDIDIIAPSHGPLYNNPSFIINAYKEWISDKVKNEVIIPYVSMHKSTEKMVEYFSDALIKRGIQVKLFNLSVLDTGKLTISLVDAATLVIATPAVLTGPHPLAVSATYLVNAIRPKLKYFSIIGSYGWGSKLLDILKGLTGNLKAEFLKEVLTQGYPTENTYRELDRLADDILEKHKSLNLL